MGIFKEEVYELAELAKQQIQIYPDACDAGIPVDGQQNADARVVLRRMIKELPFETGSKWGGGYSGGQSWRFFVAWEQDGGEYRGTEINIGYHYDHKKRPGKRASVWLSIDMQNARRPAPAGV